MAALGVNRAVRLNLNNKQSFWRLEAFPFVIKEEEKVILHLMIATFNQGCGYPKPTNSWSPDKRIYGFTIIFSWEWSRLGALPCENIFILTLQGLFLIRVNKL